MVEMVIESVRVSLVNYQRVVILREKGADRYLPIWIGPAEADAIAVRLQEVPVARPLTHDLLSNIITTLGAQVKGIVVSDLTNDTFYARILLDTSGNNLDVDSRPSDAIALAIRVSAPIYAEERVLERAGVTLDPKTGRFETTKEGAAAEVSAEELQRLSAFKDFIEGLDLEDFGSART